MKKNFFVFTILVVWGISANFYAQNTPPELISYQGIARDASGQPLSNQTIGIKFILHQGSVTGTPVFTETHAVSTNSLGLFTVEIGKNNPSSFQSINWANGPYYLEVQMAPTGGTSYVSIGTQQLLSVPYALYSKSSGSVNLAAGAGISITGNTITNSAPDQSINITPGSSNVTVSSSYPNYTIDVVPPPAPIMTITGSGVANVTPTTGMNFNVDVPPPSLSISTSPGGNSTITINQGTASSSVTLPAPTISLNASSPVTVTPSSGNNFSLGLIPQSFTQGLDASHTNYTVTSNYSGTISVPAPTLTINSPHNISNAHTYSPTLTIQAPTILPTNSSTNNIASVISNTNTLTYTINVPSPTLSANTNTTTGQSTFTLSQGPATSTTSIDIASIVKKNAWLLGGNPNTNPPTDYLGTPDAKDLVFKTYDTTRMQISSNGNVSIGTTPPHPSAGLDVNFTDRGLLIPRMTTAQRNAIASPANFLLIFNTTTGCLEAYEAFSSSWKIIGNCLCMAAWNGKANFGGLARRGAVGFSIGSKGYIGTGWNGATNYNDFWEYDPSTNVWTQKADFGGGARRGAVGFSIGSKGYIGTGWNGSTNYNDFWEYDPATNVWTQKLDFAGGARRYAVGFSIGSKGYIGTGYNDNGIIGTFYNDLWEYDPATNAWTQKADFGGTARYGAVGFSIGSKGYIGTGNDGANKNDFWEYDPVNDSWTQKANFGGGTRRWAVGFSIGSKGYIGTGYGGGGTYYNDFWEYDPATNVWSPKANFGGTARYLAVGFSIGSKGYIGTGHDGSTNYNDFWEYCP